MLLLLGTTVTTCFLDSLNPSTIAQQMILQSMMKTKRHICFFILGIGLTNLILGLAVYYGMAAWVAGWLSFITARYPVPVCSMMLIAGILCFVLGICRIRKIRSTKTSPGDESFKALDRLSPASLFLLGALPLHRRTHQRAALLGISSTSDQLSLSLPDGIFLYPDL